MQLVTAVAAVVDVAPAAVVEVTPAVVVLVADVVPAVVVGAALVVGVIATAGDDTATPSPPSRPSMRRRLGSWGCSVLIANRSPFGARATLSVG